MDTKRKIQLSALAVIANGILALTFMAPRPALADSCNDHSYLFCGCGDCEPVPGCNLSQVCSPNGPCGETTYCAYY